MEEAAVRLLFIVALAFVIVKTAPSSTPKTNIVAIETVSNVVRDLLNQTSGLIANPLSNITQNQSDHAFNNKTLTTNSAEVQPGLQNQSDSVSTTESNFFDMYTENSMMQDQPQSNPEANPTVLPSQNRHQSEIVEQSFRKAMPEQSNSFVMDGQMSIKMFNISQTPDKAIADVPVGIEERCKSVNPVIIIYTQQQISEATAVPKTTKTTSADISEDKTDELMESSSQRVQSTIDTPNYDSQLFAKLNQTIEKVEECNDKYTQVLEENKLIQNNLNELKEASDKLHEKIDLLALANQTTSAKAEPTTSRDDLFNGIRVKLMA